MVLLFAACAGPPVIVPDRPTAVVAGGALVSGERAGVRVTVDGDAWQADPRDLGEVILPVLVTVTNHSHQPVRVGPEAFGMLGDSGVRYQALPPDAAGWPPGLPNHNLRAAALPEEVLQDGQQVMGFVYFPGVPKREAHVAFGMMIVEAQSGQPLGVVTIPFTIRR
jgi:hypothetical protein